MALRARHDHGLAVGGDGVGGVGADDVAPVAAEIWSVPPPVARIESRPSPPSMTSVDGPPIRMSGPASPYIAKELNQW